MNIPKKDVIGFVLKEALRERPTDSQQELAVILNERLAGSGFVISGPRARRIALLSNGIETRITTRKGPVPKTCPGCGGRLRRSHSKDLKGRKLLTGLSCRRCSYKGRHGKWIPSRYRFRAKWIP